EIGIWIVPEEQGQGYATEASRRVIDYVFNELNRHKIVARTFSSNEPSKRIWEKLGFEHEATLHEEYFNNGDFRDVHYYSLLEQDHD
ncbi:MAG: GNAT family protein, partial [Candidatus Nanohaloarchaea archaeon]|nr:GNAT family protein [Candidatus Nanohaloarchaea archaeon]